MLSQSHCHGGVADGRFDLRPVSDDASISHEQVNVAGRERGYEFGVESEEGVTERGPASQNRNP